jgi:threonine/homoserine/homoserine lactone efflux protein
VTILDALLAFAVVAGLLTLVPGLDTALVLRSSLTRTRSYAWATAWGVAAGAMVWGVAAAVGISALLAASEAAYRLLTLAGAGYMLWLGASMIAKSFRSPGGPAAVRTRTPVAAAPWRGWLAGAGTNLLNPKVGVFYVATIPQFLPAGTSPVLMGAALAGVHCVLSLAWFAVLILGGGYARRWLASPKSLAVIDRVTGLVLVGFGARLIAGSLPSGPLASLR